jgi:enoyl-CoA hydratase
MSETLTQVEDGILVVTINRPEAKNAMSRAAAEGISAAMDRLEAEDDLRVAILTGAGGTFCSGMDLKGFLRGERPSVEGRGFGALSQWTPRKPVIAAVDGYAVAGGLELALWCDLRVADPGAKFGVFCRRWGVPLIDGGTVRLPRLVGTGRALDMILTGRPVSAQEALDFGLATRVVEPGTTRAAAEARARELTRLPQSCLRNDRRSVLEQEGRTEQAGLAREFELGLESLAADALSGAARFAAGAGRHGASE